MSKKKVDMNETVEVSKRKLAMIMDCVIVAYHGVSSLIDVEEAKAIIQELKKEFTDGK